METAYKYIGQNKWIKSQLGFSLRKRKTPSLEDSPPPGDTPSTRDTPSTEGTLSTEGTPLEDTPSAKETSSTEDTPLEDTLSAKGTRIADILHCDFKDCNTELLIKSNSTIWSQNPSSFYNKGINSDPLQTKDTQCRIIHLILRLVVSDAHSHALRRIYSVVLHRIRASYPRSRRPEDIARLMYGDNCAANIVAEISSIMVAGPIYAAIGAQRGFGILLFLGTKINVNM